MQVIDKAKIACNNAGQVTADHFADVSKMVDLNIKLPINMFITRLNLTAVFLISFLITKAQTDTSFKSTGNPIITHKYTVDPAALVYKDKVYLYTGYDLQQPKGQTFFVKVIIWQPVKKQNIN